GRRVAPAWQVKSSRGGVVSVGPADFTPGGSKRMRSEMGWSKSTCGFGVPAPWVLRRTQAALVVSRNCQETKAELAPVSALALLTCATSSPDIRNAAVVEEALGGWKRTSASPGCALSKSCIRVEP